MFFALGLVRGQGMCRVGIVLLELAGGGTAVVPRDPKTAATGRPFTFGWLARKGCVLQWTCPSFLQLKYKRRYSGAFSRTFFVVFCSHVCYETAFVVRSRALIRGFPPEPLNYFNCASSGATWEPLGNRRRALPTILYVPLKGNPQVVLIVSYLVPHKVAKKLVTGVPQVGVRERATVSFYK